MKKMSVSKKELEHIYHNMTVRKAAEFYGLKVASFYYLLDKAGIERKIKYEKSL